MTVSADKLRELLGEFPEKPSDDYRTIESVDVDGGTRHLIEFVAEDRDTLFDRPPDLVRAYLFVPDHTPGSRMPAIVAIHQDGPRTDLGKLEPAGLDGDPEQFFGVELFRRGYVVICPDRLGHADRRELPDATTDEDVQTNSRALSHFVGQLLLAGRNWSGKEAYDMSRVTDILCGLDCVDIAHIGAIGFSAGGYALGYFMFADDRIAAGASVCGFFELVRGYHEKAPRKSRADSVIPGLARVGTSADYVAHIAPRPFLMTRGLWEWGQYDEWRTFSEEHVAETKQIEAHARHRYDALGASEALQVIYFDEKGGDHAFPPGVKAQVYDWLDNQLSSD